MNLAFLDDLKNKATDLAQAGIAKSKAMAEIARLKANNLAEEDALRKAFAEIGRIVCDSLETGAEADIDPFVAKVKACKALIEANNAKIEEIKNHCHITDEEAAAAAPSDTIDVPVLETIDAEAPADPEA